MRNPKIMCNNFEHKMCSTNNIKMSIQRQFVFAVYCQILKIMASYCKNYNKITNQIHKKEIENVVHSDHGSAAYDILKKFNAEVSCEEREEFLMGKFLEVSEAFQGAFDLPNYGCHVGDEKEKLNSLENEATEVETNLYDIDNETTDVDVTKLEIMDNSFLNSGKVLTEENKSELRSVQVLQQDNKTEVVKQCLANMEVTGCYHQVTDMKVTETKEEINTMKETGSNEDICDVQIMKALFVLDRLQIKPEPLTVYMLPDSRRHPREIYGIPWECLNHELKRLITYALYPHSAKKSAVLLAQQGFAYCGSGKGNDDRVICCFCCATKQDWHELDNILEVHKDLSPECPMVTEVNCNNVKISAPSNVGDLFKQVFDSSEVNANENKNKPIRDENRDEIEDDGAEQHGHFVSQERHNQSASSTSKQSVSSTNQSASPTSQLTSSAGNSASKAHRPFQMATQTVMKPSTSSSSQASQQTAPSSTSNSKSSTSGTPSRIQTRTNTGNTSSSTSAAGISGQQVTQQNSVSASGTASPQTIQAPRSGNQVPSPAVASSSSANQSTTPLSQGNSSQTPLGGTRGNSSQAPASGFLGNSSQASTSSSQGSSSQIPTSSSQGSSSQTPAGSSQGSSSQTPAGSTQNPNKAPTYGDLGIITERPKRFEYAVRATRYTTFDPWPRDHFLKKEDLADAGFYYAGYGDCARCFYCGGGLRNWEDDDNVWVEHARWFPKCAFIRQTMGQQFVDTVQDLNKSHDKISFQMVTDAMGTSAASFHLDSRNTPLKRDPAVLTVMDMGYNEKDVIEAALFVKEKYSALSADKLYEKLEKDRKIKVPKGTEGAQADSQVASSSDPKKDEVIMKDLKEQNFQLRQQTVCKICMDKEVAVVFLPCGHLVSCTDCAAAMKDCPLCRKQVRGIVRAFMG